MKSTNTIIIGGGIAGLMAANKLHQQGNEFLLLEAKPELGGRILTVSADASRFKYDLGPTWFWPHQERVIRLLEDLGIAYESQYTQGAILYQLDRTSPVSRHPGGASMLSYKVVSGMKNIVDALYNRLDKTKVKCGHGAVDIDKQGTYWKICTQANGEKHQFNCKNLILAIPPRQITKHLNVGSVFSSQLIKDLNVQQTWMSAQAKFVAEYSSSFWREDGLAGQAFSRVGPLVEIHDASMDAKSGALFGFVGIPASIRRTISEDELKTSCIKQLEKIFGEKAANPKTSYLKDWSQDSWVATTQDINETPRHAAFNMQQHSEELKRLHISLLGSEFATREPGYIEGALEAVEYAFS